MNLKPINPYHIIKQLSEEIEALKAENEALKAEVEEYATLEASSDGQDTE